MGSLVGSRRLQAPTENVLQRLLARAKLFPKKEIKQTSMQKCQVGCAELTAPRGAPKPVPRWGAATWRMRTSRPPPHSWAPYLPHLPPPAPHLPAPTLGLRSNPV